MGEAAPGRREQSLQRSRAFEAIGYTAATYSDKLTFPSCTEYLGRIKEASKIMADVYAANQNAPLSRLLPAYRQAYEDRQAGHEPPIDEVSYAGAQHCDINGLMPYGVLFGALMAHGDVVHIWTDPESDATCDGFGVVLNTLATRQGGNDLRYLKRMPHVQKTNRNRPPCMFECLQQTRRGMQHRSAVWILKCARTLMEGRSSKCT